MEKVGALHRPLTEMCKLTVLRLGELEFFVAAIDEAAVDRRLQLIRDGDSRAMDHDLLRAGVSI